MPRRGAAVAVILAGLSLAASARATVSVVLGSSDPDAFYNPGETITLTVHVTANAGETDNTVSGNVEYLPQVVAPGTRVQNQLPAPPDTVWVLGALACFAGARCVAFSQVAANQPIAPIAVNVTDFQIATLSFDVLGTSPLGAFDFTWQTTPSTRRLDFFGVTSAPGYSVTIIPEPATAALLGLGLLGLGLAGRRRA